MATKIGSQDGIVAFYNRQRDLDPGGTLLVKGSDGKWPDISTLPSDLSKWKAIDKKQRCDQLLKDDHDAAISGGNTPPPNPNPPAGDLSDVQGRMFLAQEPLDCLQAPSYMVPVCTADLGYRHYYSSSVIQQLKDRFGKVEAWCDCKPGQTDYSVAVQMVADLNLNGPAWGECEAAAAFDNCYNQGGRRMIGNLSALTDAQLAKVAADNAHVTSELYRNVMPWQLPDWKNSTGVGGNAIACYASSSEGATYYPVSRYISEGLYVSRRDSVYAVGLKTADWQAL
jgi:hypothetical protein